MPRHRAALVVVWLALAAAEIAGCSASGGPTEQAQPIAQNERRATKPAQGGSAGHGPAGKPSPPMITHRFDVQLSRQNEADAEGFVPLTLADFDFFGPDAEAQRAAWSERNGVIVTGGRPRGYAYTRRAFRDFVLRLEYRFPRNRPDDGTDPNTGVLLFLTGPHRVWPACLEAQGKFSEMATIKSNSRDVAVVVTDDARARSAVRRPVGRWNALRIVARGGALRTYLNDRLIASSRPTSLVAGPIGLQSEGFAVEFRGLRIRELVPTEDDAHSAAPPRRRSAERSD
ncbi:MAG: DUF1080 domain-containing protein [Planctomycetota bacterium]|nr:MAG: DUF1080 domain-containing protein [Planctomycetota bacterium]